MRQFKKEYNIAIKESCAFNVLLANKTIILVRFSDKRDDCVVCNCTSEVKVKVNTTYVLSAFSGIITTV